MSSELEWHPSQRPVPQSMLWVDAYLSCELNSNLQQPLRPVTPVYLIQHRILTQGSKNLHRPPAAVGYNFFFIAGFHRMIPSNQGSNPHLANLWLSLISVWTRSLGYSLTARFQLLGIYYSLIGRLLEENLSTPVTSSTTSTFFTTEVGHQYFLRIAFLWLCNWEMQKSVKVTSKITQVPSPKKLATFGFITTQDKSEKLQKVEKARKVIKRGPYTIYVRSQLIHSSESAFDFQIS